MVSEPGIGPPGIDRDLGMVFAGIEALRELASDPERAQESAKIHDFSIRWGVLMSGRLERLEHYHRSGELTQDQEIRYRELRHELRDAARQAERLGIARPTIVPED